MSSWNVGRSSVSSYPASSNTKGDAQVPKNDSKNQVLKFGETKNYSSPSESSQKFLVQLLLLAAPSIQCPQTFWCQLDWVQASQSTSKQSLSSPQAQAQAPQLLQGSFASEFQKGVLMWAPSHVSSATRRQLWHRTHEFAHLAWNIPNSLEYLIFSVHTT